MAQVILGVKGQRQNSPRSRANYCAEEKRTMLIILKMTMLIILKILEYEEKQNIAGTMEGCAGVLRNLPDANYLVTMLGEQRLQVCRKSLQKF